MPVEAVPTPSAAALGPYTPAVRAGDWIVVSGQIGIDPSTGKLAGTTTADQVRQAMANLAAVLADCGCGWADVAKVTLFVASPSPSEWSEINDAYTEAVGDHRPARSTIGCTWLPGKAVFEIEAWVHKPLNTPEAS